MQKLFIKVGLITLILSISTGTVFATASIFDHGQNGANRKSKVINGIVSEDQFLGALVMPAISSIQLKPGYLCTEPPFSQIIQVKLMSGKQKGKLAWYYVPPYSASLTARKPRPFGYILAEQDSAQPTLVDCKLISPPNTPIKVSLPNIVQYGAN